MLPVPVTFHEETDALLLRAEIAALRQTLGARQQELGPLEAAFMAFDRRFHAALGTLIAETDAVRRDHLAMEDCSRRLLARLVSDPDQVLGDVFSDEEIRQIGAWFDIEVPDAWFERSARHDHEEAAQGATRRKASQRPPISQDLRAALKACYHRLARKWHPDHARSDLDRSRREELMLRINAAWHAQDLDALHRLEASADANTLFSESGGLAHLVEERDRLTMQVAHIRRRLHDLRRSPTFPLWHDGALADAAIARRRRVIQQTLEAERMRRIHALQDLRTALGTYATRG